MRKNYIKVSSIPLTLLNNGELLSFMEGMRRLLPLEEAEEDELERDASMGAPKLNISAEQVQELDETLEKLHDKDRESQAKKTTRSRKEVDKTRDALAVAIIDKVIRSRSLPAAAARDAAETLYNMAKTYVGISRLPQKQETERIVGMLMDFAKPEYAAAVSELELQSMLDDLKTYNDLYRELTAEDSAEKTARSDAEGTEELRETLYAIYEEMRDLAFASNLLNETEESVAFLKALNTLIAETKTAYNQRGKKKKEDGGKKEDDQKEEEKPEEKPQEPDEKPTEPTEPENPDGGDDSKEDEEGGGTHFEPVE